MLYLIDGYNLFFRSPPGPTFEHKREALIEKLIQISKDYSIQITVVFDGKIEQFPHAIPHWHRGISLVYTSSGQSADDYILEEVLLSQTPATLTIVSSDEKLSKQCRLEGAKSLSIQAFATRFPLKERKNREESRREFAESSYHIKKYLEIFEERWKKMSEGENNGGD